MKETQSQYADENLRVFQWFREMVEEFLVCESFGVLKEYWMGKEGENIGGVGLVQKSGVDKEKISKKGSRKRGLQKSVGSVKEKFGKDVLLSIMDDVVETELNVERMKLKRDEDRKGFQDSIEQKRNARREAKKGKT
eukprot:CAMPEP_0182451804 /NCGR_PEP_ID=MMETSP1172-20130603/43918_1 /TAXON_ID=708627 /ORGANISM="Timspurckia oligopyrenoides, Strain CCMP3278" /LENGTH=136 /DNA_ID=CAMNT_0024649609 /DNA_START=1138 /DNA_END=1549 /DNA_ORIENTATION=-